MPRHKGTHDSPHGMGAVLHDDGVVEDPPQTGATSVAVVNRDIIWPLKQSHCVLY